MRREVRRIWDLLVVHIVIWTARWRKAPDEELVPATNPWKKPATPTPKDRPRQQKPAGITAAEKELFHATVVKLMAMLGGCLTKPPRMGPREFVNVNPVFAAGIPLIFQKLDPEVDTEKYPVDEEAEFSRFAIESLMEESFQVSILGHEEETERPLVVDARTVPAKRLRGKICQFFPAVLQITIVDITERSSLQFYYGTPDRVNWINIGMHSSRSGTLWGWCGSQLKDFPWNEEHKLNAGHIFGLLLGILRNRHRAWEVIISRECGYPSLRFVTDQEGARSVFQLRDRKEGQKRRPTIKTWRRGHYRVMKGKKVWVRDHLMGHYEWTWAGWRVKLVPSVFDAESNELKERRSLPTIEETLEVMKDKFPIDEVGGETFDPVQMAQEATIEGLQSEG